MSDDYAKEFRNTYGGTPKLIEKNNLIVCCWRDDPSRIRFKSRSFVDQVQESVNKKYAKKKYGGKVQKMAKGGAAFPDLTGDGKTRADILKGRWGFGYGGKVGGCRGGGAAMAN